MKITATTITDMFAQLHSLGRTDVRVHCGHCLQTLDSPAKYSVHLLTCECRNPTHDHRRRR